jgi:predicted HTH transcriptional regulator
MINNLIDEIGIKDIQDLIENGVVEGKTIEYKQELVISTDNDKKEFLYDVSSFANAGGGDLIFGITEDRTTGLPQAIKGFVVGNLDEELRKIESLIRDGIQPRLARVDIRSFKFSDGLIVLLIRIAKGWNAPHQVTFKGADKFYTRAANGKYKLDVLCSYTRPANK